MNNIRTDQLLTSHPDLGFTVPEPKKGMHPFLSDPKTAKDWFTGLPMANTGETAKQIYQGLKDFNRLDISNSARAKIIEMFRVPVGYIRKNLEKLYIDNGFPLSSKADQGARLAIELDNTIAISYKIIVENILRSSKQDFDSNLLVISLHRTLHYLLNNLFQCAIVYRPAPLNTWREIHKIYAYALSNGIHKTVIKDEKHKQSLNSIEALYSACLLFASADTNSLRQTQIQRLFVKLTDWTNLVDITPGPQSKGVTDDHYFVDIELDNAPVRANAQLDTSNKNIFLMEVSGLLRHLHAEFDQAPWDLPHFVEHDISKLPKSLIRLLIKGWSKPAERRHARTHLNFELRVIVGLYNIHRMLDALANKKSIEPTDKENSIEDIFKPEKTPSVIFDEGFTKLSLSNIEEDSLLDDTRSLSGKQAEQPKWTYALPPEVTEDVFCVLSCNESAEGYCLVWKGKEPPKVKVGELIGIQSANDSSLFSLGIVRWMKQAKDGGIRLGLHIQSPGCKAVSVVSVDSKVLTKNRTRYQCLLLTEKSNKNETHQLVTSAINFQLGTVFNMETENAVYPIKLLRLVESNGAFAQYEFNYIDTEEEKETEQDDFNDLWPSI